MLWGIIVLLGGGVLVYSLYRLVRSFIKKESKKPVVALAVGGLVLMGAGGSQVPAEASYLSISQETYETDQIGQVTIKGETNKDSELTIDEKSVNHDGSFSYQVQLTDDGEKQVHIKSIHNGEETVKILTITPSKEFLVHLETQAEKERLEQVETALKLAENQPTQEHYDTAFTKIQALSQNYPEIDQRLTDVDHHLKAITLIEKLETSLDKEQLAPAKEQVSKTSLNQSSLQQRITSCEAKIAEKEQIASTQALVEKAEASVQEADYQVASEALAKLPNKQDQLEKRLVSVQEKITANKQAAEKAEAERQAQEQAQAAAAAEQTEQDARPVAEVGTTVMITRTGSKYHTHKCGNGTYFEATLAEAQSRGLAPCDKCF